MTRRVGLIDTTLRDGNQSIWATRMPTRAFVPILPTMDDVGYSSIELFATVQMEACVRYLKENPWERMRLVRQRIKKTPLRMLTMTQFFSISRVLPDDVVELFAQCVARNGIDIVWLPPSLNDVRNIEAAFRASKRLGLRTEGAVLFTESPIHTDEYFVQKTRELVAMGVDAILLKDAGGLLTPERARTLFPAMMEAASGLEVYCHSHCVTGLGPAVNLEAVRAGVSQIWTCSHPLANGYSLPSGDSMQKHLTWLGYQVDADPALQAKISEYWREAMSRHGIEPSQPAEYDPSYYSHHMPGGMLKNFEAQLAQIKMEHRLAEILEEMPRVRKDLGYPNSMTPFSQFIATQALLNVLHGRYEVVPDEVRGLVLGYWGTTPGPVDPDILDKVGGGKEPVTARSGELVPPVLDRIRAEQGPFDSDEDLLFAVLFMPAMLQEMRDAGPIKLYDDAGQKPLVQLVKEVAARPSIKRMTVVMGPQH
jgi:oxaloacetate decarboxylase alpha subunit